MAKLVIRARGLCAAIPKADGNGMRVVLVNGMQPRLSELNPQYVIEAHYPFIAIPDALIPEGDDQKELPTFYAKILVHGREAFVTPPKIEDSNDATAPLPADHRHAIDYFGVFLIPEHKIRIETDSATPFSITADAPKADGTPDEAVLQDLTKPASLIWTVDLPRLVEIEDTKAAVVRPEVMMDEPPLDLVAAFIDFDKGAVSSSAISIRKYGFINARDFGYEQLLAFQLFVKMDVTSPPTVVFSNRRTKSELKMTLEKAQDGENGEPGEYNIVLDNTSLDEIVGIQRILGTYPWHSHEPYYHFEMLYKLSANPPKNPTLPVTPVLVPDLDPPASKCAPLTRMTTG